MRRLIVGIVALNVIVAAVAGLSLRQSYHQRQDQQALFSRNIAQTLERQMASMIDRIDMALQLAADDVVSGRVAAAEVPAYLSRLDGRLPSAMGMGMTDAQGTITAWTGPQRFDEASVADRSYFKALRDDPPTGLAISKAVRGKLSGGWQVVFARSLRQGDGRFDGIVYAVVLVETFAEAFSRLDLGAGGAVVLRHADFSYIARHPDPRDERHYADSPVSAELRASVQADPASGTYISVTPFDGKLKTVSYHRVGDYPLYIIAAMAAENFVGGWYRDVVKTAALGAVFALTTILLFRTVQRAWRDSEAALEETRVTRARLHAILQNTPLAVTVYAAEGQCILANHAAAHMIGGSIEELTAQNFRDLPPWRRFGLLAAAEEVLATGTPQHLVTRFTSSFGRTLWVEANLCAFAAGSRRHLLVVGRDVTAEKAAEEALRTSEEKLRRMYELSPLGIALTDMEGRYVEFNEAFRRITGYSEAELKALDYWALTPPKYRPEEVRQLELLETTGRYGPYEKEYVRKDGTMVPLRLNGMLVVGSDGARRIWSMIEDVSERRQAEQILRASEERYRGLVEGQRDFVVRVDRRGRFTFVNEAFAKALGRRAEDLVGSAWRSVVHPGDVAATRRAMAKAVTPPAFRAAVENRLNLSDDAATWVAWEAGPIRAVDGTVTEVQAAGRDITEWVEQRRRLQELVRELDASNRELEQFAYIASHDLREPLRMIGSYITLIERRYAAQLDDAAREFIGFARDGARHMDRMVLDLLEFSRVGRLHGPSGLVPLREAIDEALANLALAIADAGAEVAVEGEMPTIEGWRGELVRLLQNLIGNAVKYRHPGRPPKITISAQPVDDAWTVSVADNGIGIAPEFFQRIFSVFQRLHTRAQYEGTGIGLAICRKVVEHHGGRIWVESRPDSGSVFHFTLPQTAPQARTPAAAAAD